MRFHAVAASRRSVAAVGPSAVLFRRVTYTGWDGSWSGSSEGFRCWAEWGSILKAYRGYEYRPGGLVPFDLTRQDNVFILTMDEEDNRFNATSLGRLTEILDEVESADGPAALVTTGTGKF